jgi:hypothetical protein
MSAFLLNSPVNRLCGIVFNRFYRLEIHSLSGLYFQPSLCTVTSMDEGGTILVYVYCCPSSFSLTYPPFPPSQTKMNSTVYTVQTVCVTGGGGGGFNFGVYQIIE